MANTNPGGYMDNVRVKISEKYKPPPKIGLAMSYAQRLTLNKQIQDTIPKYEFLLEKTVIEKMREWRTARAVMFQELKERLDRARAELDEHKTAEEERELSPTNDLYLDSGPSQQQQNQYLTPTYSNILTPIPLKIQSSGQNTDFKSPEKSPFNISDFEADTSSPFDNMELKSINDLEELAQVLKHESKPAVSYTTPQSSTGNIHYPLVGPSNYATTSYIQQQPQLYVNTNGYYYPPETIQSNSTYYNYSNQVDNKSYSCSPNITDIMKTLQNELDNTHLDNTKNVVVSTDCKNSQVFPKTKSKSDDFSEEFQSLPKNIQDMSKSISSMGFPLLRVARVCKIMGDDQKKVVEHLLAMSELLDLGFSESSVSRALLECDNDRDKALDILIS